MKVELRQLPIPPDSAIMGLDSDPKPRRYVARVGGARFSVIVSRDNIGRDGAIDHRWHISVAGDGAVPTWDALAAIVHELRPGIAFGLPLPPRSQWINYHENCLHVWEVADEPLVAQWAYEGRGDPPT